MQEVWKGIAGYDGLYQVSNFGRVKSLPRSGHHRKDIILKPTVRENGYKTVYLYSLSGKKTQILVHRLVSTAFLPNPDNKECVNHKNGNKSDNRVENLEWATTSENMLHAAYCLGRYNKRKIMCVETSEVYLSIREAGRKTGVDSTNIIAAAKGRMKTAGGVHWKYVG